ncbi:hypothetical protein K7H94_22575 (plasmid) [Pantoea dispersa]|uniref:fimbrial protein n=1 Tax=Pantoea dispersa TaxID=59814 RepID=UPI001CA7B01C|nr:fimbrial protein [Pantoea dispersa]QZY92929.1 hypothetical protein K7H94_22575 [Pantoea dispersa]
MKFRKLCTAVAALTLLSAASHALASTGSINFVGHVTDTSCTISGLTSNVKFSPVNRADIQALNHGVRIEDKPITISVTGCPANLNKASLAFDFNEANEWGSLVPETSSDARGIGTILYNPDDNNNAIRKGAVIEKVLSGGQLILILQIAYFALGIPVKAGLQPSCQEIMSLLST